MLVSVITPTRNRREFIPGLIAQFLAQTHEKNELIIISDGDPIGDLIPSDSRIRHYVVNGSIGEKLNFGVQAAAGRVCVRFDDDDWQAPERIMRQLQQMAVSGKSVVACSSGLYYTLGDDVAYEYTGDPWNCSGFSHAFTRVWAINHPYPDSSLGEDAEFIREAHAHGQLSTISGVNWIVARTHPGNTSPRNFRDPSMRKFLLSTDNWREVPLSRIAPIIGG